jgi:hypothetical protein
VHAGPVARPISYLFFVFESFSHKSIYVQASLSHCLVSIVFPPPLEYDTATCMQVRLVDLFSELYSPLLFVLDDMAVYTRGDPFPLPTTRAIALSLNSLVFSSHITIHRPTPSNQRTPAAGPCRLSQEHRKCLARATAVLQQLHSRHIRRAICPLHCWLAPWHAAAASDPVCPRLLWAAPQFILSVWVLRIRSFTVYVLELNQYLPNLSLLQLLTYLHLYTLQSKSLLHAAAAFGPVCRTPRLSIGTRSE